MCGVKLTEHNWHYWNKIIYVNYICKTCNNFRRIWSRGVDRSFNTDSYDKLFEEQKGRCAICGKHQIAEKRKLSIDHNHETGKVRGLLCNKCNYTLGIIEGEGLNYYVKLINYLKNDY